MKEYELKEILDKIIKCPYCLRLFTINAGFGVKKDGKRIPEKMDKVEIPNELKYLLEDKNLKRILNNKENGKS